MWLFLRSLRIFAACRRSKLSVSPRQDLPHTVASSEVLEGTIGIQFEGLKARKAMENQ